MNTMEYYNKNVESNGTYVPVERYTDEYCKALTENYKQDTMRSYERWIMKGDSAEYYGGDDERPRLSRNFTQFAVDSKSGEEFLYLFSENEWNGFSINHKYDDDYTILDTKIIPVEIPDFDVADDS